MPLKSEKPSQREEQTLRRWAISRIVNSEEPFDPAVLQEIGEVPGFATRDDQGEIVFTLGGISDILEAIKTREEGANKGKNNP